MRNKPDSADAVGRGKGSRFSRKLYAAFAAMLVVILALAWYFYDSVKWYEHDIQRIALANQMLQEFHTLSGQAWRMFNAMDRAVAAGGGHDERAWQIARASLDGTLAAIRANIQTEARLAGADSGANRLGRLADLERVVGQITDAQSAISRDLSAGQADAATATLERLYAEGLVSLFDQMTRFEIEEQREAVRRVEVGAIGLAGYLSGLMPLLAAALIALTLVMAWLFSRSLTRSVNALHDGAVAFSSGDLAYRIPELREAEFDRLGREFNTMARELAEHREGLREAQVKLEAMVEERTRALKASNEKLESIDDNRRQLLADISHEFRTPLTVIQGEAEIALRGSDKRVKPYRETLQRILEQVRHTTRLVDDLLFIARAEVGEPRLNLTEAPVAELLDAVCEDFSAAAERKSISLRRHIPEVGPVVTADTGRLRQVFSILVDNAVKYSEEGGEVDVGLVNDAGVVTVTVEDRGIGLSPEDLKHVFERYYRSNKAASHDGGTGLGLPVARAIIEAHGGQISLEAREGGGITSTVRLPVAGARGEAA